MLSIPSLAIQQVNKIEDFTSNQQTFFWHLTHCIGISAIKVPGSTRAKPSSSDGVGL